MTRAAELPLLPLMLDAPSFELRRALEQEGIPCVERQPGGPAGRFVLASGELTLPLAQGQCLIDLESLDAGEDCEKMLSDRRVRRAQWTLGSLGVQEEVSHVDKRAVRRRWMTALRAELERQGGVWLKIASCPFPYRSAFNLRVDHDDYHAEDFHALQHALRGQERAVSHYVCAADFVNHPEALAELRGWHVGGHGYHHHTYPDHAQNRRNIARGLDVLAKAGLEPDGFVAPHGKFNLGLHQALVELGTRHSSEFGLMYDELPGEALPGGVLQVPVHPVSLGVILEAARRFGIPQLAVMEPAIRYFEQHIAERYQEGEPVLLYDHPTARWGRFPQVVRAILSAARDCGMLWRTTLAEIARWWYVRREVSLRVYRDGEEYVVFADRIPTEYRVAVEFWRGEHVAPMPLAEKVLRFSPSALAYQRRRPRSRVEVIRVDRAEGLRGRVKRMIDWEKATPIKDIDTTTFAGWMKRTLRKLRDE